MHFTDSAHHAHLIFGAPVDEFNANASRMAISSITLAELLLGAEKSSRVSENLAAIEDFCSRLQVLPYGPKAAQHYGAIRAALEKLGQLIGVNDMHIAAHARSEGLVLVTNNMAGVRLSACYGSRELGSSSAVMDELWCIRRTKARRLLRQVCRDSCGGAAADL